MWAWNHGNAWVTKFPENAIQPLHRFTQESRAEMLISGSHSQILMPQQLQPCEYPRLAFSSSLPLYAEGLMIVWVAPISFSSEPLESRKVNKE